MKKVLPKEINLNIGRTPTSKITNNISLFNKRGVSTEEKNNKSLFKNCLEFKKSNPYLEKINKPLKTEVTIDKSKENHNILLTSNVLVTATTSSIGNINNSLVSIDYFEIIEKIFRFIKPKISHELYVLIY